VIRLPAKKTGEPKKQKQNGRRMNEIVRGIQHEGPLQRSYHHHQVKHKPLGTTGGRKARFSARGGETVEEKPIQSRKKTLVEAELEKEAKTNH